MNFQEIEQAKKLFEKGNFERLFTILKTIRNLESFTDLEKLEYHLLKSSVHFRYRQDKECIEHAEIAFQLSEKLGYNLYSIDALLNKSWAVLWLGNFKLANELTLEAEKIFENLKKCKKFEIQRRKAFILFMKASCSWFQARIDGLACITKSLEIRKKLAIKHEIVEANSLLCAYYTHFKDDLDYALQLLNDSQSLAIEINHPWVDSYNSKSYGDIYYMKGDLEKALNYYKRGVRFFENLNHLFPAIITISEIGNIYREMGDINQCCDYLKYSYDITRNIKNKWVKSEVIANLIDVLVIRGDIDKAEDYLRKLKEIYKILPNNKRIAQSYLISKALILKSSPRFQTQAKAQDIFTQIIKDENIKNEYTIIAILNQCDLLLEELKITNRGEIIDEVKSLIDKLLEVTNKLKSYWTLAEALVLQAKLSLLTLDLIEARTLLTRAQRIANKYHMHRLAIKISNEHDELLQKLDIWKKLKKSKSTLIERFELTDLNNHLSAMIKKQRYQLPKTVKEEPVLILIISNGGNTLFCHQFVEEKALNSHILGGFLTSIDYFIKEVFSEDLDRAIFGDYTLLMNSLNPFFIGYIFKGKSYNALQKINSFSEYLKKENNLWVYLMQNYAMNKIIHIEDNSLLMNAIKSVFLDETFP